MDNSNKMESHPRINGVYTSAAPKILFPSSASFSRIVEPIYQERPMTLNAWTQTTNEDAEYLRAEHHHHEQKKPFQESENERRLLEKIRVLEKNLLEQSELLSQIHATSAGSRSALPLQPSHAEHNNIASPNSTSLINQFQQEPKETINYTIIADAGNGNGTDEPIEIELAEDDGALNLNSSVDSERLEIYIADEQVGIKTETLKSEEESSQTTLSTATLPTTSQTISTTDTTPTIVAAPPPPPTPTTADTQPMKRRKIDMKSSPPSRSVTNIYINQNGLLTPVNMNSSSNVLTPMATYSNTNATPLSDPPQKRKAALKIKKNTPQSPTDQTYVHKTGEKAMVSIGPNNTLIPEEIYMSIPWKSASIATRRLLMTIFDRATLATHSMTGKPSPAFKDQNKPLKKMLDRTKVEDILYAVTTKCNVTEKEVRNAITTKCADENKMMKLQMGKNNAFGLANKENVNS